MPQFHETGYGQRFYNGQLPNLIDALEKIGKEMQRANDLKEKEMKETENKKGERV